MSGSRRRVFFLLAAIASFFVWRQCNRTYGHMLPIHAEVVTSTATKLCALARSERGVPREGFGEFTYPAQRARQFLASYSDENARESHRAFTALLVEYEALLKVANSQTAPGSRDEIDRLCAAIDTAAGQVRDAVAHE